VSADNAAENDAGLRHGALISAGQTDAKSVVKATEYAEDKSMTEDDVIAFCNDLPGAVREQPFGPETEVWKVGGKIFALMATGSGRVSVKCADPDFAEMLISVGRAGKAPYLPRGGWIAVELATLDEDEMRLRLRESYDTVRSSLPKRVQQALG